MSRFGSSVTVFEREAFRRQETERAAQKRTSDAEQKAPVIRRRVPEKESSSELVRDRAGRIALIHV